MDILISMRQDENSICMEIRDDGVGFDLESTREHRGLGLCSIEERVAKLGGSIDDF